MKKILLLLTACLFLAACRSLPRGVANYDIIPLPQEVEQVESEPFLLNEHCRIVAPETLAREARFLAEYLNEQLAVSLSRTDEGEEGIVLALSDKLPTEGWQMQIGKSSLRIEGGSAAGVFYGIQALRKMLPPEPCREVVMPAARLAAWPRFSYRGMHFDVARHFFDKEFVKKYIDILALHGINTFHWHLSDDQGWRIEIKRYPLLTSLSAERKCTVVGRNTDQYDNTPYGKGCFFTQEEAREIVAYAAERHIMVIPEIDMPGHMVAALHAYPELGCRGEGYEVWPRWGVSEEVLCAGNDRTLEFAKGVLSEILEIFPAPYVHIGGDECPKSEWQKCPRCQARIASEGLDQVAGVRPEEALQGWFMREISDFLKSKGRTAIGWDEVLMSPLVGEDIVVMSWRGDAGALEAAQRGIRSIMAPQTHLYFDHYQSNNVEREPLALGGNNTLERVYHFDPTARIPDSLRHHVLGVQANLWTEYIADEAHVMHMLFPRLATLNEIQWCDPAKKEYAGFLKRLICQLSLYEALGYNYAPYFLDVTCSVEPRLEPRGLQVSLATVDDAEIRYTLDGSTPTAASPRYEEPLLVDRPVKLSACAFREGEAFEPMLTDLHFNRATATSVTLASEPLPNYRFAGAGQLTDGLVGDKNYRSGRWLGFRGGEVEATIDLGAVTSVQEVAFQICVNMDDGCMNLRRAEVSCSVDGEHFECVSRQELPAMQPSDSHGIYPHRHTFPSLQARYVRLKLLPEQKIPDWHPYAAGSQGFLFVDEIEVR